ncbi:type I restriction endonuclease [Verticiella alkaliphila]|uniref:type I restriction endonuclease n=1 Tax=Verticiella alkaliphila TaxID=2779529 RepID=UPI001C0AA05A
MEEFKQRIAQHVEHVKNVGMHCSTEETTKQALILPLLGILGFNPYDPTRVRAEYGADFPGVKVTERVDYALFTGGLPVMFIEAKSYSQDLTNHCPQLSRYYNATPEVTVAAITNGREWRFFTDLVNRNIMDREPFMTIHFDAPREDAAEQLHRFHHDQFQPDTLRALAEESIYLSAFRSTITSMLRECDLEFVKYVASRASIQRTFTSKFLESVQPLVKHAMAQSISAMVATSLSEPERRPDAPEPAEPDGNAPIVDPDNDKIVTTGDERRLYDICCDILPGEELQWRDTETYFTVTHGGRSNRWLFRFWGDRRRPTIQFIEPITDAHRAEAARAGLDIGSGGQIILDKPENLYRLAGMVRDALGYCKNDENFRRSRGARDLTESADDN